MAHRDSEDEEERRLRREEAVAAEAEKQLRSPFRISHVDLVPLLLLPDPNKQATSCTFSPDDFHRSPFEHPEQPLVLHLLLLDSDSQPCPASSSFQPRPP